MVYNLRTFGNVYTIQNILVIVNKLKSKMGRVSITSKKSSNTSTVPSTYIPYSLQ